MCVAEGGLSLSLTVPGLWLQAEPAVGARDTCAAGQRAERAERDLAGSAGTPGTASSPPRPPLSQPPGTDRAGALRPAGKASAVAPGDPLAAVRAAAVCPAFAPGGQRFVAYKE